MKVQKRVKVQLYTFFNLGARWGGWTTPYLDRFTLSKETRHSLCRRLVGSQGRSGRQRKISPPPGFDPQTVHSVACRYPGLRRNNIRDEKEDEESETEKENSIERKLKLKSKDEKYCQRKRLQNAGCVSAPLCGLPGLTSPHISALRSKLVALLVATWVYVPG